MALLLKSSICLLALLSVSGLLAPAKGDEERDAEDCSMEDNYDYYGNDIRSTRSSGVDSCANWCAAVNECKVWTMAKSGKHCYLKSSAAGKTKHTGVISGSKGCGKAPATGPFSEEDSCVTDKGTCIFPFTYKGLTYNGCTKTNHNQAWCATKKGQTGSWWGDCPSSCQMHISELGRCSGIDGGCCTRDKPCEENDGDCDSNAQCMGDLRCGTDNCIWGEGDDCCYSVDADTLKKNYLALKNDGSKEYKNSVKEWLPILLQVDTLKEGEVGVAFDVTNPKENYPLALLNGEGIVTDKVAKKSFAINGTVNKWIGKRSYYDARYRPVGLYAKPGDIITITIPKELVGKINAKLGQDHHSMEFELDKTTQKIGSPWGGLILIVLRDSDATTKHGQFNVEIENAVQAPYFVYSEDTNEEWNKIKHNAAPWTVLRIPGQVQIYIQTLHVKTETDMNNVLKGWKETMDMLDDLMGIPLNIQPGEERLHWDPKVGGGLRWNVCTGGGKSAIGDYDYPHFLRDNCAVVYHEWGHGYCYSDLPSMGGQWTAEIIREYIERKKPSLPPISSRESKFSDPFNVLYRMVSFSKMSNGESCGKAKFPDSSKTSYPVSSYDNCWTYLYRLPLFEFGWDILKQVLSTDATLTTKYDSKTDRMADLYCKATKSNLIPLFQFYNIEVSTSVKEPCEEQTMPDLITKYIDIANCIMEEDIEECTKLPGFPAHKGLCTLDGVCNSSPDNGGEEKIMNNEFDLWGSTFDYIYKSGARETAQDEEACLKRANEMFSWCDNDQSQIITATFTPTIGDPKSSKSPPQGNCYYDYGGRLMPEYQGSMSTMIPEVCNKKCLAKSFTHFGVQHYSECWCGNKTPKISRKRDPEECDTMCSGDKTLRCGGGWRTNIWKVCSGQDCSFEYE